MFVGETTALSDSVRQQQAAWGTDKKGLQTKEAITVLSLCMSAFPKALIRRRGDKNNAFCFTWQLVCNIYQMSGECVRRGRELRL